MGVDRPAAGLANRAGQFECLIEAAFAQTLRMQGQWNQSVDPTACRLSGELLSKVVAQRQAMGVFEGLNQLVYRKVVAKNGKRCVIVGRMAEAAPAVFA